VRFEQPANQFIFDRHWMDKPAKLGNRTTYAAAVKLCDELLADLSLRTGVAGKIRASLLQDIATRPTFAAAAKQLGTTTRTLRRQLQQQGTSFRELVDELRAQVAVKYLRDTVMTNEDIATAWDLAIRRIFAMPSGAGPAKRQVSFGAAPAGRFDFPKAQPTEPIERRLLNPHSPDNALSFGVA
jgi:AraC-like DNA-binding protein